MPFPVLSARSLRPVCLKLALAILGLLPLLLPAVAQAQSTFTGGGMSFTTSDRSAVSSTATVSGATGTVKTVSVELDGVKSDGVCNVQGNFCNYSLQWAEFLLEAPNGDQFVLLASTGDGADGCDNNPNQTDPCNGLQGTTPGNPYPDTITITDTATSAAPYDVAWFTSSMPYTVKPSSYYYNNSGGPPPLPGGNQPGDFSQTDGCSNPTGNPPLLCSAQTLSGAFLDATANGTWTLYLIDNNTAYSNPDPVSISGWKLTLTYNSGGAASTTTSITSSVNPASYANSASNAGVTFTAIVTSSGGTPTGTVSFTNSTTSTTLCSTVALSGGVATCTASLTQGVNSISAAYSGSSGTFGASSTSMVELVEVTAANPSGDQWCNNRPILVAGSDAAGQAYPALIKTSGYPGGKTVANVQVELNGLVVPGNAEGAGAYLLVGPGGTYNLDFMEQGFTYLGSSTTVNLTFSDSASGEVPQSGTPSSSTYLPTDDNGNANPDTFPGPLSSAIYSLDSSIPQIPGTLNFAPPYGTGNADYTHTGVLTFGQAFNGAPANGTWALYGAGSSTVTLNSGWCITLSLASGNGTTTTLTPSSNPATFGQALTFTAAVNSGGIPVTSGGTVTFLDNNAAPAGSVSGNNVVSLGGNGQATFTTSSLSEGDHTVTATYSGTPSDNESFSSVLHQRINGTITATNPSSNTWQYCNAGPVEILQESLSGPFTPNPSVIAVTNLPGTLSTVSLTLNNFFVSVADDLDQLASLVEGPTPQGQTTGPALDFFSNTTQSSNGTSTASSGNYTFEDSAPGEVSSGNTNLSPGPYKPTAYESFLNAPDVFTSNASGFYPAPTAGNFSYAAPTSLGASSTFADVFTNGSDANGNWELFFSSGFANGTFGAAGGWCLNFTENLPTVTVSTETTDTFTQGQQNAPFTINIENNGPGAVGDPTNGSNPMTISDTLNSAFTFATGSGTGWSCSANGQNVTCTNDSPVAQSSSYPTLTIDVNVSATASTTGTIGNSVSAGGAGASMVTSSTDSITIDALPAITSSSTTTFTVGTPGSFTVTATGTPTPTINDSGALPTGVSFTNNGNGTATLSGTPAAGTGGTYPITFTAANGTTDATQNFTLTVFQAPTITTQPVSQTVTDGNAATFSVAATGVPTLTYQWQYLSGSTWKPFGAGTGYNTATLTTFATTAAYNGLQFRVVVTDGNGLTATSNTVTLTVGPTITTQPVSQTITDGSAAIFTVVAAGVPTLTYQWQYLSGTTWKSFGAGTGYNTATLTTFATSAAFNGLHLRVVVTDVYSNTVTSNTVTLTVDPAITTQPVSQSVADGGMATFSVVAAGVPTLTYQWQYLSGSTWKPFGAGTGYNTASLTTFATSVAFNGLHFRVVVTDGSSNTVTSNTATLTVNPAITTQPTSQTVTDGKTATFSVVAAGVPTLTYQWQYLSGSTWKPFGAGTGYNTATLTTFATSAAFNGLHFRVVATDGNSNTVTSNTVTLTVDPAIRTQPTNQTVTTGSTATFSVVAAGVPTLTYQWQYLSGSTWKPFGAGTGYNTATLTTFATTAAFNGLELRVVATDGNSETVTSNTVTLTVH